MKKEIQAQINKFCEDAYEKAHAEFQNAEYFKRLRNCQAWVYESENYIFLVSYNTMIAFIDKKDSCLYDVLRYVFGYTATSAQHISKFSHDYYNLFTRRWNWIKS